MTDHKVEILYLVRKAVTRFTNEFVSFAICPNDEGVEEALVWFERKNGEQKMTFSVEDFNELFIVQN